MNLTYFIFCINNYILLLRWGNFILAFYSDNWNKFIRVKHAKEMKYDLDDRFN